MSHLQTLDKYKSYADAKSEKGSKEGKTYEKLSLVLLAERGYELSKSDNPKFCDFVIGREVGIGKDAKFDDIVFQYKDQDNTKNLIFIQIKYKQDDYQIDSRILSAEASKVKGGMDGNMARDFNLQKYFISFLNAREELKTTTSEMLTNGTIKYVAIFTNSGINIDDLNDKGFELRNAPDDIKTIFTIRKPSLYTKEEECCYQLVNVSDELRRIFKMSSDLYRIARELARYVVRKDHSEKIMRIDKSPVKHYHVPLANEVIDISGNKTFQNKKNVQYCEGCFKDDFIYNDQVGSKRELRDAVFEAIREFDESKKNATDNEMKSTLKEIKLKLVSNFGKTKQQSNKRLPDEWNLIKEEDVKEFLNSLIFIVNQPRIKDLQDLISKSTKDTVLQGSLLSQLIEKIDDTGPEIWMRIYTDLGIHKTIKCREKWISGGQIAHFIEEQKHLIKTSFLVTAMSVIYENEILQHGKFIKTGELIQCFLLSNFQILCIYTPSTFLSAVKILQYLKIEKNNKAENGHISISLDMLKNKVNLESVVKAFELKNNNLLTIECRKSINKQDLEELFERLSNLIKSDSSKKVILIVPINENNTLAEKFRRDFQNTGLYLEENDAINLKDFKPNEDPFKKQLIVFQGQEEKISLAQLLSIKNWDNYIDYISENGIQGSLHVIDEMTLVKILQNDELIVGCKALDFSSLEGAYFSLSEEINLDALSDRISSQVHCKNTENIYIFSGIKGRNKIGKMNKIVGYLKLENKREIIDTMFGDIGSESVMQIADDQFKDENFHQLTHRYPEKEIFWINVKNIGIELQFMLRKFYNPNFYISRKFRRFAITNYIKKQLKENDPSESFIFSCVKDINELMDLFQISDECEKDRIMKNITAGKIKLFTSEENAESAIQKLRRKKQAVYWLKCKEEQLIWYNSHGSLDNLRIYINENQNEMSFIDEDNLIKEIRDRKIVIIADDPGMGKTTTLTKLYERKYKSNSMTESHWVIRVNLREHLHAIRNLSNNIINIFYVVEFLSKVDCHLNDALPKNLLKCALDRKRDFEKTLLLTFDGFDEVLDGEDRRKIILLFKYLKDETSAKIWITTRSHFQDILETELSTLAIEFVPMDVDAKLEYITMYLKNPLCLTLNKEIFTELFPNETHKNEKMSTYCDAFLSKMESVFKENISRFIGTPLQLYLMLEGSVDHFKKWIENDEEYLDFSYLGNDISEVYENFIGRKYDIYFRKGDVNESVQKRLEKYILDQYNKDLAKSLILELKPKRTLKNLIHIVSADICFRKDVSECVPKRVEKYISDQYNKYFPKSIICQSKPKKDLENFRDIVLAAGIVKARCNHVEFIHTTFRDYFAAKVFIGWITKDPNVLFNSTKQEYLLTEILVKANYQLIRTFMNIELGKIIDSGLFIENDKQLGKLFAKVLDEVQNPPSYELRSVSQILNIAVYENNSKILYFLLNMLKEHKDSLKKILFVKIHEYSPLHIAIDMVIPETVKILLNVAERLSEETLQMLLGFKVIYIGDKMHSIERIAANLREIAMDFYSSTVSKHEYVYFNYKNLCSAFFAASESAKMEVFVILLDALKRHKNILKQLLLYNNKGGILHCTICPVLYFSVRKEDDIPYFFGVITGIIRQDYYNNAIIKARLKIVEMLLKAAKDINDNNNTLKQMLLIHDGSNRTALDYAILLQYFDIAKLLNDTERELNLHAGINYYGPMDPHTLSEIISFYPPILPFFYMPVIRYREFY